jgi:murein L,D-transpeptidase YcbB/YkuD
MRSSRLNTLLAGSALALVLACTGGPRAFAQTTDKAKVDAGVPVPDTTVPAPPSAADIKTDAPVAATPAPAPAPVAATPAPAAAPVAASADTAVSDKLREMSSGKFDRILGGKKERSEVEAFYSARNFAPLWVANGAATSRAQAAAKYLGGVEADGLEAADYPVPDFAAAKDADAQAEAELKMTNSILDYAHHASTGRVHYTRVSADIAYDLERPSATDVLKKVAEASDVSAALDGFEPQHPAYKALKAKYAELRAGKKETEGPAPIPQGATLKFETPKAAKKDSKKGAQEAKAETKTPEVMSDDRVPMLRARLGVAGDKSSQQYDAAVADAVRGFQKEKKLPVTGQLNNATVDALNVPKQAVNSKDAIIATMERWRWIPRQLGNPYVMVNIPDFTLKIEKDDKTYWKTKIVTGQPGKPTPLISAEMKFITVNPTWNVPPSIIQNEYLPALKEDPTALERIGLKVEQHPDGTVRIYQPPGDRNALGRIRFNFPNKFLVYQHDTPDKYLFAKEERAFSHGCMRVENPLLYGEKILSLALPQENYTADRLQKMFGGGEININFPKTIPVHLTYQTAFVDDEGKLQLRKDVYGRDAKLLSILRSPERKVADIAIERAPNSSSKPVKLEPGALGGSRGWSGPNFFEMLFGGGNRQPEASVQQRKRRVSER